MTDLPERALASKFPAGSSTDSVDKNTITAALEQKTCHSGKASLWSSFFPSNFSIYERHSSSVCGEKKVHKSRNIGWTTAVKKVMTRSAMRRLQERILGTSKADVSSSTSEIWLLGTCYKALPEEPSGAVNPENGLAAFLQDFSSRIWLTYRKGFDAIGDSRLTSDVGWACMIRSSQMLVAQALIFHHLGRAWRKSLQKPYDPEYIKILHHFGDSEACAFSIHNLLQAGRGYGLVAGSWLGPYAMCRTWETLARAGREHIDQGKGKEMLPMAVYIVSGDEDGERGGAPVVCIDVASRLCSDFNNGEAAWAPILLLVPLVLGLEKVNPRSITLKAAGSHSRIKYDILAETAIIEAKCPHGKDAEYIPLLSHTFKFPQSLGILGGKSGVSTYIVGVQDDKALYLDPHEVQPVVEIKRDNLEADTSSYHCSTVRKQPLEQIDPSLAIGFYCRDEDDFKDFCLRASELGERSNGAPLFTVSQSLNPTRSVHDPDSSLGGVGNRGSSTNEPFDVENSNDCDGHAGEDDWQLL